MKLTTKIRNMRLRSKVFLTAALATTVIALPLAVNAGFFPGRTTFDYNKYDANNLNCNDPNNIATQNGRCGSMNGPVFNSFVNTPSYGDERYFTDGYRTDQGDPSTADTVKDVTEGSKQVVIRMYVHNNANQDTNASGKGIARNAKVSLELPTQSGSALQAVGAISASNSAPAEVSDTVYLTANRKFHVDYVEGSAKLLRGSSSYALNDSIVSGGALIGDKTMDGNLPGCFDYAALVEVTVNIIPDQNANLQVLKQVKKVGDTTGWHKEVAAKPGDTVQWLLTTKNIGLDQLTNVQVRDILPPNVSLVPGSVQIVNADQNSYAQQDQPLFGNGLGLGVYPSSGGRYVLFKTTTLGNFEGCSIRDRNIAKAMSTETPTEVSDTADVIITKENCNPPKTPTYTCDMLNIVPGSNRTATFTTTATGTNGATVKLYTYSFGDGTPVLVTDKASVTHTYAQDGQYAANVKVTFAVNGQDQTVTSTSCAGSVTFKNNKPVPPTVPPTTTTPTGKGPTQLVNTGPGEVAMLFVATSMVGAFLHRRFLSRV